MKKLLLSLIIVLVFGSAKAQNLYNFGFDGTTAEMLAAGWQSTNQSAPTYTGAGTWTIPATNPTPYFPTGAQAGGVTSLAMVDFTSVGTSASTGTGTISNWLISPAVTVQNGDVVSFYTRIRRNSVLYADNMQFRMSLNGAASANPTGGATNVGDFTTLLLQINPTQNTTAYPTTWTKYSYTVSGLAAATSAKFAFRYYVTNGGPAGTNSDGIGIDTFSVDRPLATESFFAQNFAVFPNPATDVINIESKNNSMANHAEITDINGRVVKTINGEVAQINISQLNAGVYLLKLTSSQGSGTAKIIKK